jgi:DNA-binding NarL/FixJ family response regulator
MPIAIYIFDDHQTRIDALIALISLNENMQVVGFSNNCSAVLKDVATTQPDLVLMDINMPLVDGLEGLKLIKTNHPEVKVLMQTAFDDSDKIFESISNGASGYILKNDAPLKILQAIQEVYEGGAVMNPLIAQKVLNYFIPKIRKSPLTNKEEDVLQLLAQGLSYKMVANDLGVSYSTINTHAKHIYDKLHISSLGEAIAWYYNNK